MIVTYFYGDTPQEWNCSNYNCVIPARAINRTGVHEAYLAYLNDFQANQPHIQALCEKSDIIFIERNFFGDVNTMAMFWKVRNKVVAGVFDDAYDLLHPLNIPHKFWNEGTVKVTKPDGTVIEDNIKPPPLRQLKFGLPLVKGATMPSVMLCKDWGKYTKTYYLRNVLEFSEYQNVTRLHPHDEKEIYIGWCGSLSHLDSFLSSGIITALDNVCQKHSNVKVLISGDKRIFDELPLPENSKIFQEFVQKPDWPRLVKSLDIGLAPLTGRYDLRRSWIKGLEYMMLQVPWIGSDCITYNELRWYGLLVENTAQAWEKAITETINDIDNARKYAKGEPYIFALSQTSDLQLDNRLKIYQEIIDSEFDRRDVMSEINQTLVDHGAPSIKEIYDK